MKIALTGVGNTGKTTLSKKIQETYGGKRYEEIARECFEILNTEGQEKFQMEINKREIARIEQIKNTEGLQTIDRTTVDNWAYFDYNKEIGKISKECIIDKTVEDVYDVIIYFNKSIKETTTEKFSHYNEGEKKIDEKIYKYIKENYKNIYEFENFKDNEQEIMKLLYNKINPGKYCHCLIE